MKQFNLEEYLKNPTRKVITRDGRKARIICTDAKGGYPVIGLVEIYKGTESALEFSKCGAFYSTEINMNDLFFAPEKHEGWINIFKNVYDNYIGQSRIFESKEAAEKYGKDCKSYIATVKIEWEE